MSGKRKIKPARGGQPTSPLARRDQQERASTANVAAARVPSAAEPNEVAPRSRRSSDTAVAEAGKGWRYTPLAVGVGMFVLYALTTAHSPVTGDNPDFLIAAHNLSVAHPPGYPLATLLGHVSGWFPFGSTTYGLNLIAAVMGGCTAGLVTATARRLGAPSPLAVIGAVLNGINPLVWLYFLQLEAFPFAEAATALLVYLVVRWYQDPYELKWLLWAALAFGVGMNTHLNVMLIAPGILYLAWKQRKPILRSPMVIPKCGALVAGGFLVPYIYVLFAGRANRPLNWQYVRSIGDLKPLISREVYDQTPFALSAATHAPERWMWFLTSFSLVGLLTLAGAWYLWRSARWCFTFMTVSVIVFMGVLFVFNGSYILFSYFIESRFYLQWHAFLAPLIALGLTTILRWLPERLPPGRMPRLRAVTAAGTVLVAVLGLLRINTVSIRNDDILMRLSTDLLRNLPENAVFLTSGDVTIFGVSYARYVENVRPDVTVMSLGLASNEWYIDSVADQDKDLKLPVDLLVSDKGEGLLKIIEANPHRPFVFELNGTFPAFQDKYYFAPRGVSHLVVPWATTLDLNQVAAETKKLLANDRPPKVSEIRSPKVSFDPVILQAYVDGRLRIAEAFMNAGAPALAHEWFQEAYDLNPTSIAAKAGLEATKP